MNRFLTLLLSVLTISSSIAQSQRSFERLVRKTNEHIEHFSKLHAYDFDKTVAYEETKLPKERIEHILQEDAGHYDGYMADSIATFGLIFEYQELILDDLLQLISHSKLSENSLEHMLSTGPDLSVIVSPDRQIYNFSLDGKTGGTYRSRISFTHYVPFGLDSIPTGEQIMNYENGPKGFFIGGDGYKGIDTLHSYNGIKYVFTGYVRGCSYCFSTYVSVESVDSTGFKTEFYHSVNLRDWEGGVVYNKETNTITVDYITDDLTTECACYNFEDFDEDEQDIFGFIEDNSFEGDPEKPKKCHCTYQYNGETFELVKESWEKVQE